MLSLEAQRAAYAIGVARSKRARQRGSKHLVGWRMEIEQEKADGYAAVSEAIVRDAVDGYWISADGDGPDDGVDVIGPDRRRYGVRWTPLLNGGLIVRAKDADDLTMVLVIGIPPEQQIVGTIQATDAKTDWHLRSDWEPPAWLTPRVELRAL